MKKTLSVLLSLVMLLSVFAAAPFTVSAATRYTYGDWEYEIWNGYDETTYQSYEEICITNYTGDDKKVTIPNEIDGKVIVSIPSDAEDAVVYREEEDGSLTDMKAAYYDDSYNFITDHFSTYVIAKAAPVEYKLWVNNEQITSEHLTVQCGEGTATFDPKENTLTLDNAQITQGAEIDYLGTGILTFMDEKLTIVVNGDCSITETGGDGIGSYEFDDDYNMVPHDITVTGDGKLTINESTDLYGYGFYCTGKLVLDGVNLTIHSAATGIWAKELTVKNHCDILSQCGSRFSGIVVNNGSFIVEDSNVIAESTAGVGLLLGNDQESSSLMLSSGLLTLRGMAGIGADSEYNRVGVTGGTLTIEAQVVAVTESIAGKENGIVLGEGVELISGGFSQTSVVVSDGVTPADVLLGDVNGDESVTIDDATAVQKYLAGYIMPDTFNLDGADANCDGNVTIDDATAIQKYLAGYKIDWPIGDYI